MTINDTSEWINKLEFHFTTLWGNRRIPVQSKHPFIVGKDSWMELLHPAVRPAVASIHIRFHSPTNPKSSQLLALNLFLLGQKCGDPFFQQLFSDTSIQNAKVAFEWIDKSNTLRQGGNPSNHDVLLDCGKQKYLIEMKFTEHSDAPCSSSKRNQECSKRMSVLQCPLESVYGTLYHPILRDKTNPYDLARLERQYSDCPFLHGEQFQIMRYILLCHARTTSAQTWTPVIIFPHKNRFMEEEIEMTKSGLKRPERFKRVYLEDAINAMRRFNEVYAAWLTERYII